MKTVFIILYILSFSLRSEVIINVKGKVISFNDKELIVLTSDKSKITVKKEAFHKNEIYEKIKKTSKVVNLSVPYSLTKVKKIKNKKNKY